MYVAKIVMNTGSNSNAAQQNPFSPIIAINPTRAECAAAVINNKNGNANMNP